MVKVMVNQRYYKARTALVAGASCSAFAYGYWKCQRNQDVITSWLSPFQYNKRLFDMRRVNSNASAEKVTAKTWCLSREDKTGALPVINKANRNLHILYVNTCKPLWVIQNPTSTTMLGMPGATARWDIKLLKTLNSATQIS